MRFGIEIEAFGASDAKVISKLNSLNVPVYSSAELRRNGHPVPAKWMVKFDGSIRGGQGEDPFELVSPPMDFNTGNLELIENVCRGLKELGAAVNESCGLHVHVEVKDYTPMQIASIFDNYKTLENQIDSLIIPGRRKSRNGFTYSLSNRNMNIRGFNTLGEFIAAKYPTEKDFNTILQDGALNGGIRSERYAKVNLTAYYKYRTIEFRQHHGTLNGKEITSWVRFIRNFVTQATTPVATQPITFVPPKRHETIKEKVRIRGAGSLFDTFQNICTYRMFLRCVGNPTGRFGDSDVNKRYIEVMRRYFEGQREFTSAELVTIFNSVSRSIQASSLPTSISRLNDHIDIVAIKLRAQFDDYTREYFTRPNNQVNMRGVAAPSVDVREEAVARVLSIMHLSPEERTFPHRLKKVRGQDRYRFAEVVRDSSGEIEVEVSKLIEVQDPETVIELQTCKKLVDIFEGSETDLVEHMKKRVEMIETIY